MTRFSILAAASLFAAAAGVAHAQSASVTVEDYQRAEAAMPDNIGILVKNARVLPQWIGEEGADFWYRHELADGEEYIRVAAAEGVGRPLFDHDALAKSLGKKTKSKVTAQMLKLSALEFLPDDDAIRFSYADGRWRFSLSDNALTKEPEEKSPAGAVSPDGKWRAFVRNGNLFVAAVNGTQTVQLTDDAKTDFSYATPLPNPRNIARDGLPAPDQDQNAEVYWSKDSQRLATYSIDARGAGTLTLVRSTPKDGGKRAETITYHYPLSGDENVPMARGFIFDIPSGKRVDMDLAPQPILYYYGPDYQWKDDNKTLFILIPARDYKTFRVHEIDAETGRSRVVVNETNKTFIDYYSHWWDFVDAWETYLWMSDRTGWEQLYAVDAASGKIRPLTEGAWRFRYVAKTLDEERVLFVVGAGKEAGRDPYLRTVYRVSLDGGAPVLLTPEPLDHDASFSPDGAFFVDNMSAINQPTRSVLRRADNGDIVMDLGSADISAFLAAGFQLPEPFETVAADGRTPIYGAIYRPANYDSARSYPVIDNIYTGPHYVMTPKNFSAALFSRTALSVAQGGFVVVTVDGRGTSGRSRAFLQPNYQNLNLVGLDDHEKAIRDMARKYPNFDIDRVGVYGFSAGGYDTARALFRKPDFYKAGFSASGNHDNRSDKAIWNENWMSFPVDEKIYDANSNLTWAKNLKGALMLAHGELDENVNPMATLQLVDVLIKEDKDFDFLIVPGADHYLDAYPYVYRKRLDFFVRNLLKQEPPKYRIRILDEK